MKIKLKNFRKAFLYFVGVLFIVTLSEGVLASSSQYTPGELFTPSENDQSLVFLRALFGPIGPLHGGDGNLSGVLFSILNVGFLFFVGAFAGVIVVQSSLMAATEGTALKNKIRSLTAIRVVASVLLMAPWPSGYSSMQVGMVWASYYGVGLADQIWHHAIDTIIESKGVFMSAYGGKGDTTDKDLNSLIAFTPLNDGVSFTASDNEMKDIKPADFYKSSVCTRSVFRKSQEFRNTISNKDYMERGVFGNPAQYRVRLSEKRAGHFTTDECLIKGDENLPNAPNLTVLCFGGPDHKTDVETAHYNAQACGVFLVTEASRDSSASPSPKFLARRDGLISSAYVLASAGYNDFDDIFFKYKDKSTTDMNKIRLNCKSQRELIQLKVSTSEITQILNTPSACLGANNLVAAATNFFMATKNSRIQKTQGGGNSTFNEDENILKYADKMGWMTAGMYYGKLSAQGHGASSMSKIVYNSIDGYLPKLYQDWLSPEKMKKGIDAASPVLKTYNYFSSELYKNYSQKAADLLENIAEASTMSSREYASGKPADNNMYSDNVFGNIASYFMTKVLIYPAKSKGFCMGNSISIPVSSAAIAGSVFSFVSPAYALVAVSATVLTWGILSCGFDIGVKVDIAYRNMIKSLNLVLRELLGINIYKTNVQLADYDSYDINQNLNTTCTNKISEVCRWSGKPLPKIDQLIQDPVAAGDRGAFNMMSWLFSKTSQYSPNQCLVELANPKNDCIVLGKGVLGQYFANKQGYMIDPFSSLQHLGQTMIIAAVAYWQYTLVQSWQVYTKIQGVAAGAGATVNLAATIHMIMQGSAAKFARVFTAVGASILNMAIDMFVAADVYQLEMFKTMGAAVASILFATGTTLGILIPMLPFVIYMMAGLGWLFLVVEGMIAAPLIVLGLAHPSSHDFLGKSQQAFLIYFSVFLRPSLIMVGYMFAMMLSYVAIKYLNYGFLWFTSQYVLGYKTVFQTDPSIQYLIDLIFLMAVIAVYVYVMMIVLMNCFSYIHRLPDQVSRWIDSSYQPAAGGGIDAAISGIDSSVSRGASGVGSGAGEASKRRPNLDSARQGIAGSTDFRQFEKGRKQSQARKERAAGKTKEGQKLTEQLKNNEITQKEFNKQIKVLAKDVTSTQLKDLYIDSHKAGIVKDAKLAAKFVTAGTFGKEGTKFRDQKERHPKEGILKNIPKRVKYSIDHINELPGELKNMAVSAGSTMYAGGKAASKSVVESINKYTHDSEGRSIGQVMALIPGKLKDGLTQGGKNIGHFFTGGKSYTREERKKAWKDFWKR